MATRVHAIRIERRAISLTEIVVAVIFMSIALMPLLGLLIAGHQGTAQTLHQTQAFLLADDVVEAVGALRYEEIDATLAADIAVNMPVPQPTYTRTVLVDPKEDVADTIDKKGKFRVKSVKVKVVWLGPGEEEKRTIELVALKTKVDR
ncbi:MAG: hypothetical protein HY303_20200 [Candidatus Wallbacteria bacterium]|nr:hypothetical protein [Candidatus Wallbacteria bacterium]